MIIFRTPKGWTCPKFIDGKKTEGSWRSHQVPLASARDTEAHFEVLKNWLESYKPEELFDENGAVKAGSHRLHAGLANCASVPTRTPTVV